MQECFLHLSKVMNLQRFTINLLKRSFGPVILGLKYFLIYKGFFILDMSVIYHQNMILNTLCPIEETLPSFQIMTEADGWLWKKMIFFIPTSSPFLTLNWFNVQT